VGGAPRLRVLGIGKFYPPEYLGGLESAVVALNAELVRGGCDVTYVVSAVRGRGGVSDVDGVRVVRARSFGTLFSQPLAPGLVLAARRVPADVVHLHHPNPLGDLAALADRKRPLVVTQHSDVVRQRALWPFYGPAVRLALARARRIVVASEPYRAVSRELAGFEEKVRVVPYGIDGARFEPRPETARGAAALRAAWGGSGRPVVLAVGRLVGYKGFDVLLEAARGLDAAVVLVGTGPLERELKAAAGANVTFAGRVDDAELPAYYAACDVFCLPSVTIAEAFGVVLLEAMASGKPLVTTRLPTGVMAVNRDGVTGLVVPPRDPVLLREALRTVLEDDARRGEMGRVARRTYEAEYTSRVMAERYLTVYREALAGAGT
jgi:glycosyltransferase involved in cell wall biosynthesis